MIIQKTNLNCRIKENAQDDEKTPSTQFIVTTNAMNENTTNWAEIDSTMKPD